MAYKTFVAGEEALAADVNSYLMSQTVARFANASARSSALPSPATNQLSMLDSRPGVVQYWNGSAWADAQTFIQAGAQNVTTNAGGGAAVTFPVAFAGAPVVVAMPSVAANLAFNLNAAPVATGFTFTVYTPAGALANTTVGVHWMAYGARQ